MLCQETNTAVIGRLRVRSKSPDPQAEQQRIAQTLRLATLHPAGLPSYSLLVVRRMADPLPQRLRTGRFGVHMDAAWERAATAELSRLAASAVRPAFGTAATDAPAVLFSDRAELLAAAALDWMAGALAHQWWWRELFRGRDPISALVTEWSEAPQYVPGAVEILAARSRAVPFLQRLPIQAVEEILNRVFRAHQLPRVELSYQKQSEIGTHPTAFTGAELKTAGQSLRPRSSPSHSREPWAPWVPEACTPALLPLQKLLFAQAMMLRRTPATVRSTRFQQEVLQWRLSESLAETELCREEEFEPPPGKQGTLVLTTNVEQAPPQRLRPVVESAAQKLPPDSSGRTQAERTEHSPAISSDGVQTVPLNPAGDRGDARVTAPKASNVAGLPSLELSASTGLQVASPRLSEPHEPGPLPEVIETEFGGAFFLLNLALHLLIYGDFTQPEAPGLELSPWDFIALIGRELTEGDLEQDPLWTALAHLARRTLGEPPGFLFAAPETCQVRPEWLDAFPEDFDRLPAMKDGRLVCIHPAGFTVLDMPIAGGENPIESEAGNHAGNLKRWTRWMTTYIIARLVRALGRHDAPALCLRQRAQVTFRATHVDVTFSLNRHPIELRMAGLDRDPGWLPAAGRYVAFHFE